MPHVPPPVIALGCAVVQRGLSREAAPPGRVRAGLAAALVVGSVVVAGSSAELFRRAGTTVDPLRPDRSSALVTSGAYRFTRNPMYVGMAGLLLAHALRRGSWAALLPVAGFVALIDRLQIAPEEAALGARFGTEYDAYRARVPRWLGPAGG